MTVIQDLPFDILKNIIQYLNEIELLEMSICSKFISSTCLQKLWYSPNIKNGIKLKEILTTLNKKETMYCYYEWISNINITLKNENNMIENMFIEFGHLQLNIKTLQLFNISLTQLNSEIISQIFISNEIREINLNNCSTEIISSVSNQMTRLKRLEKLNRLSIKDCYITDPWVQHIVTLTPKLNYFASFRSGYVSDNAILAITHYCPLIQTLIVTLPKHIIQSNTITFTSIQSLSNCIHLKKFICRGQVRISNQESQNYLYSHCPLLELCDLSF